MPDDPVLARYCGACAHHNAPEQRCAINMSYAAFVMLDTPANGCPGFQDRERCAGESQAQSACRPAPVLPVFQMWQQAMKGKP
jgi:hypothetical protein